MDAGCDHRRSDDHEVNGFMRWISVLAICFSLAAQTPRSPEYDALQKRLARGWNTWDVRSVAAQVLLPEGFTIRVGLKHNTTLNSDAFLADPLIGRQGQGAEQRSLERIHRCQRGSFAERAHCTRGHQDDPDRKSTRLNS